LRDNKILQAADQVCDSHRLPEKVSKRQRLLNGGRAWGAFLSDRVNAGDEKTGELTKLTFAAVMTGDMRKREAQKIAGHLNYPLQFRRPLYALLFDFYHWLESLPEPSESTDVAHRLPESVRDELFAIALLLPCCYTHLQASISPKVGATDASMEGFGGGGSDPP
jgi:hypothetical protein